MASLHRNFLSGTLSDNPLLIGGTTANSAAFANLPAVAGADYMWLVLDPTAVAGAPEIVKVTAHTAAATSITITRAQQSTTARQHLLSTIWRAVYTQTDVEGASLLAQASVAKGDLLIPTSATAVSRLAVGTNGFLLTADSAQSTGQKWALDPTWDAVTTKGDLMAATAADTLARVAVGSNGKFLWADSAQSTGVGYQYPKLPVCQLRMSSAQSINNSSATALSFDTEDLDDFAWHAGGSPTLVTPTIAGWYEVTLGVVIQADADYTRFLAEIQKNTASLTPVCSLDLAGTSAFVQPRGFTVTSQLISMNGSSDTIRSTAFHTNTSAGANTYNAVMTVKLIYPT